MLSTHSTVGCTTITTRTGRKSWRRARRRLQGRRNGTACLSATSAFAGSAGTPQTVSHTILHCPIVAPMRENMLAAYSDAAAVEPYARSDLNFESAMNHLLSNSSYMPKALDARFRKKVLPILTGCTNTWHQYFARLVHQIRIKCASYHTKIKYTSIEI